MCKGTHVFWWKSSYKSSKCTLKDGVIHVEEEGSGEGDVVEGCLPCVSVHQSEGQRDYEEKNVKNDTAINSRCNPEREKVDYETKSVMTYGNLWPKITLSRRKVKFGVIDTIERFEPQNLCMDVVMVSLWGFLNL